MCPDPFLLIVMAGLVPAMTSRFVEVGSYPNSTGPVNTTNAGIATVMLMLFKSFIDKANDDSSSKNMITQFGEMSKITSQMTTEAMRERVDRGGRVVGREQPDGASPQQPQQHAVQRSSREPAGDRGQQDPGRQQRIVRAVHPGDGGRLRAARLRSARP